MDGWMGRWVGGWVDGWMGGWVDGWVDGRMGGWVGGCMGGWMGGWVDGWVDGWMGGVSGHLTYRHLTYTGVCRSCVRFVQKKQTYDLQTPVILVMNSVGVMSICGCTAVVVLP